MTRFFGDRREKSKIISLSMIGLCLGSCVMLLPQFITPPNTDLYQVTSNNNSFGIDFPPSELLCYHSNSSIGASDTSTRKASWQRPTNPVLNNMKYIFYLANALNGVSSVALYTISISFIESMFVKEKVFSPASSTILYKKNSA